MKYSFYQTLISRSPAKPYSDYDPKQFEKVLLENDFQDAILLASPDLHRILEEKEFIFENLNTGIQLAVFKYHNRMCFRPTPFGAFASVSTLNWSKQPGKIIRDSSHQQMNFQEFGHIEADVLSDDDLVSKNPTVYRIGNQFRFITRQYQGNGSRANFRIMRVHRSKLLVRLFNWLKTPRELYKVTAFIKDELDQVDAKGVLKDLLKLQVLERGSSLRVTGEFDPVSSKAYPSTAGNYTLAFHKQSGSLAITHQGKLLDAVYALRKLAPSESNHDLSGFIKRFSAKFEGNAVPLLQALDPQYGLSYLGTEKAVHQLLMPHPQVGLQGEQRVNRKWTAVTSMLMTKLIAQGDTYTRISLSEAEIEKLPFENSSLKEPPSISVMFRFDSDGSVLVEQAGGSSAVNLAGRFSHDPRILEALRAVASSEQKANPGVVFAEIAAADNLFTDNINSRGHIRDYEIPVLVRSSLAMDKVLPLSDLYLQMISGKLILRSKRLNCVIIPRLASSYNYKLGNLPLFRFLADLQLQGLRSSLSFDPEIYLPGLVYYPRITYKKVILSAAKWIWEHEVLTDLKKANDAIRAFHKKAKSCGLTRHFALTSHDQQLVFDLESEVSISYFMQILAKKNKLVLQEYLMPSEQDCTVNQHGQRYTTQFISFLVNEQPAYQNLNLLPVKQDQKAKYVFLPGDEWLYFKIYGHIETLNAILNDPVLDRILSKTGKRGGIRTWFFVRYADPGTHLRLRMKCDPNIAGKVLAKVNTWMKRYLVDGLVTEFTMASYLPETQRYGFVGMKNIERVFLSSSELVLEFQKLGLSIDEYYCCSLASMASILSGLLPAIEEQLIFLESHLESMSVSKMSRVDLDTYFRLHRKELDAAVRNVGHRYPGTSAMLNSLLPVVELRQSVQENKFKALIADLIHMHLNRLNAPGIADFERNTYYLLLKYQRSAAARARLQLV